MSWQRRARVFVGLSAVGVAVAVVVGIREREPAPTASPAKRADPAAVAESTGAVVVQAKGTRQDFRIEAERQSSYADGSSRLENVKITVLQRGGRDFVITGRRAEVRDNQTRLEIEGDVHVSSEGLALDAERASYDDAQGVAHTPGPVRFTHGRFNGTGTGATYERDRDMLIIDADAHISGSGDQGPAAVDVVAQSAVLARQDDYLRFEGDVAIQHGAERAGGETAVAYLSDDEQRIETLELRGGAQVLAAAEAGGAFRQMVARDIDLRYADDGRTLRQAVLVGEASLHLAGPAEGEPRQVAGERIDIALGPNGTTVTELSARKQVVVEVPATRETPARRIRAADLDGTGDPANGLKMVQFGGGVEYREIPAAMGNASSAERLVKSRSLDIEVGGDLGDIKRANFTGTVALSDGDLDADAEQAKYDVEQGTIELAGAGSEATKRPQLNDRRGWLEAGRIVISVGGRSRNLTAVENVKSVVKPVPAADSAGDAAGPARRAPGMLAPDQPVNVTAAQIVYDEATALATYSGGSNLWQGERAVQAQTVVVNERTGDLTAKGAARSRMVLEQVDPKTKAPEKVDTIASADQLVYEDALRRATYTTNAHTRGPQGDVQADRIELYLGKDQDALERAEAFTQVRLRLESRAAMGQRLTYFANDGRYVMDGTPVQIFEELATECRETTGRILTFYRSTDTITVDGNEEHRTQTKTKTGGTCPEPPLR